MTENNLLRGLEALGVEAATQLRASIAELKQQARIAVALRESLGEAQKEAGGTDADARETFETILAAATREGNEPSKLSAKRTAEILDVSEQEVSGPRALHHQPEVGILDDNVPGNIKCHTYYICLSNGLILGLNEIPISLQKTTLPSLTGRQGLM